LSVAGLALDIVAPAGDGWPGDDETARLEVIVTGFELADTRCDVGPLGAEGGCELLPSPDGSGTYHVVVEPMRANDGLSIYADIVGAADVAKIAAPPLPQRRSDRRLPLGAGLLVSGLVGSFPVYRYARRKGSNEVFAGGATDAAYGKLPAPRPGGTMAPLPPVTLVPDDEMADLATIEFVPPKGIDPWQGQVLLTERINSETVSAWFSGLAGKEAIVLEQRGSNLLIGSGPKRAALAPVDAQLLDAVLATRDPS
jgi:hypothetical protein